MHGKKSLIYFFMGSGLFNWVSDEIYLKAVYRLLEGKQLNLKNPKMLNEKMQWLKLYNRKPEFTDLVDKYKVKDYIKKSVGEEYVIPSLGVWKCFDDIPFEHLPNKFVLKCTHDSGGLVICKDKSIFDRKKAKQKIEKCLRRNYYWIAREWPYKSVNPQIIAEKFIEDNNGKELVDYKFYCYGGEPRYFMVSYGEAEHSVRNHKFDMELNSIDHLFKKTPMIEANEIEFPINIEEMIAIVKKLAKGFQHIRIDLYNINGKIYFGEMTFFSGGGFIHINSQKYEEQLASYINVNINK